MTLEDYVDHIDHVCQLAGSSEHAAIGGDTDGQGGVPEAPFEIDTVVDYQKIADVLSARGYRDDDVENVMYRNWQRSSRSGCRPRRIGLRPTAQVG